VGKLKDLWTYLVTDPNKQNNKSKSSQNITLKQTNNTTAAPVDLEESTAKHKLGFGVLLFILINAILGSSLFYLPSLGVISSGPASLIVWPALYIIALMIMLYIAELITTFPSSGGTYEYTKKAYGRPVAFTAGWLIWIAGNLGFALNIVAAAQYFIPETGTAALALQIGFSIVWIIALNYMAFRGIDAGATMLVTFGILSVIVFSALILPSFIDISALTNGILTSPWNTEFIHPFFTHSGTISIASYLFLSLFLISESFFGFDTITYLANDAKDKENLHKVLFAGIAICGVIVTLYILSSLGTISLHDYVNNARPWAVQALNILGPGGQNIIVFGMYLVIIGAAAAWPITSSRLIQAMAKDKLFITHFSTPHPKHKTPYKAIIFQTIAITLFTLFIFQGYIGKWGDPYRTSYLIYVLLSLIVITLVLFTVPILRKKFPKTHRPFKAPFARTGPIAITILFAALIANWIKIEGPIATSTISLASSFVIIGIPIYFLIEMYYDKDAILKVNEILSHGAVLTEKLHFPNSIRNKLLDHIPLSSLKNKKILEYGCGIGSLTKELSTLVGKNGNVFAVDTLKHNIKITSKRTKHLGNVTSYLDDSLEDFNVFLPMRPNLLLSVGMLSYMQKPKKILTKIGDHLTKGAQIRIIDYDKFFYFMPNVEWIEDDKTLTKLFKDSGFNVTIQRKRGLLWTYIIIEGYKT
jgi:basic amino acid/polyamine antiporter, APA family